MAYFNHAFKKTFLATGTSYSSQVFTDPVTGGNVTVSSDLGFLTTNSIPTYVLNTMSQYREVNPYANTTSLSSWYSGYIGLFDAKTNLSLTPDSCCNIYIAGSAIYSNDKIGPFAGGYQETNKSKMINPRYVQKFYRVDSCAPQNEVLHVGSTYWTAGGGITAWDTLVGGTGYTTGVYDLLDGTGVSATVSIVAAAGVVTSVTVINPGKGYTVGDVLTIQGGNEDATITVDAVTEAAAGDCCKEFLCGETYYLRIDIKGSPALRFLNHNAYYTVDAYTGCCAEDAIAPTAVDSTLVMIEWANRVLQSPIISPFLQVVVQDEAGVLWYAPGTSAAELAALGGDTWDNYVSPGHVEGACAGLVLNGAYVDTKFGDCTFQVSDFYEKQPVKIYASEVDYTGDPCVFTGICTAIECEGLQAMGLGESVLRDLILSEQYRQNFFASSDFRIREITQGNQIVNAINRNALYTRYYLLHSVPRFNNPTGVFDNDRYLLEIVANGEIATLETRVNNWLEGCANECAFEEFTCNTTCSAITFPASTPAGVYPANY